MMFNDCTGSKKLIVARIHAPVFCEEFKYVGFLGLFGMTRFKRRLVEIFRGLIFKATILMPTNRDRNVFGVQF